MDLRPGDKIFGPTENDQYIIIRPIGNGAFGIVYEIEGKEGSKFALKTIITAWLDVTQLEALENEGKLAIGIQHPNVLRVIYFHDGKTYPQLPPYMIMEYANGGNLDELLKEQRSVRKFFNSNELRTIFYQLASGMKALNDKLVHRDIKPDNILLVDNELKIADFGLSKLAGVGTRTITFKGINHLKYCAPEAWRLEKNTPSMDMYSMGIVFYEIATLEHPYHIEGSGDLVEAWKNAHFLQQAKDPRSYNKDIDLNLAQIIIKMISKRVQDRYSSWDELIQRLQFIESPLVPDRDVSSLVATAIESHRKKEQTRLNAEIEAIKTREHQKIVEYCFCEIVNAAKETINSFNQKSDFIKLSLNQDHPLSFSIRVLGRVGKNRVHAMAIPVYENYLIENKLIKAWGHLKAPSGRGFNVLLVPTSPDDLYGHWKTLHISHNPLVMGRGEQRLEPFPFDTQELPKELQHLNAIHIYQTQVDVFRPEMIDSLLQELL
jgi:eukaryotic-like serine/threonine-protein kinase